MGLDHEALSLGQRNTNLGRNCPYQASIIGRTRETPISMRAMREGKPTLADVAKEVGVSVMIVSNVVNGRDDLVRNVTRDWVDRAVAQLGYRPNNNDRLNINSASANLPWSR